MNKDNLVWLFLSKFCLFIVCTYAIEIIIARNKLPFYINSIYVPT